jgi:micrococcal nuclease
MRFPFPRAVLAAFALLATGCADLTTGSPPSATSFEPNAPAVRTPDRRPKVDRSIRVLAARVTSIVDGDTIDVRIGSRTERVRLIGMDTPERGTPYFWEATRRTGALAPVGSRVFLELDLEHRDRYGRLLAYVWAERPDSRRAREVRAALVNARVLLSGLATTLTIQPNSRYADLFIDLQRDARAARRGFWGARARSSCDPSYPGVCIPPRPPDLDCSDVSQDNFRVRGADPHAFDGNGDGYGCEG